MPIILPGGGLQFKNKQPQSGKVWSFGDSVTNGTGLAVPAVTRYPAVVAAGLSLAETGNFGTSGHVAGDMMESQVGSRVFNSGDLVMTLIGLNDMRYGGPANVNLQQFARNLTGLLAWVGVPDANKITSQTSLGALNPAVTFGGAWSTSGNWASGLAFSRCGAFATAAGNTLTATVAGNVVHVGFGSFSTAFTGQFQVLIDGITYAGGAINSTPFVNCPTGDKWQVNVARFQGLSSGAHTVQVKTTNASNVLIGWIAGYSSLATPMPNVYVGSCLRMVPAGYSTVPAGNDAATALAASTVDATAKTAIGYQYGDCAVNRYNETIKQICGELAREGLCVQYVDVDSIWIPAASQVGADNVHPLEFGHAEFASKYLAEIAKGSILIG